MLTFFNRQNSLLNFHFTCLSLIASTVVDHLDNVTISFVTEIEVKSFPMSLQKSSSQRCSPRVGVVP